MEILEIADPPQQATARTYALQFSSVNNLAGIVKFLTGHGFCARCTLRFLNYPNVKLFQESDELLAELVNLLAKTSETESSPLDNVADNRTGAVCPACLGLLQPAGVSLLCSALRQAVAACGFVFREHSLAISLPPSLMIRNYAAWHALVAQQLAGNATMVIPRAVEVKDVLKWVLGGWLHRELDLRFSVTSDVTTQLTVTHDETSRDHVALTAGGKAVPTKGGKKAKLAPEEGSGHAVVKNLQMLDHADFIKLGICPPKPCSSVCTVEVACAHAPMYIAGRYIKYSREVSQSPWIINGARHTEHSVEEVIGEPLQRHFRCSEWKFISAGREDLDVRMLGAGRPFVFELLQPRPPALSKGLFADIQREINARLPEAVQVSDLQRVPKSELTIIKEGEQTKTKVYRCIVWVSRPVKPTELEFLKDIKDLQLNQKTPIRVLHRRSLATRKKTIHRIGCEHLAPNFVMLDLETQAGTYIKEFVHSDLGRTFPNFGSLLNCEADILQLDVMAVSLAWPAVIDHGPDAAPRQQAFKNDFADMIARSLLEAPAADTAPSSTDTSCGDSLPTPAPEASSAQPPPSSTFPGSSGPPGGAAGAVSDVA
eukprot:TRINITY_DN22369_c0_g1_i1.p1 TRINITY_DN22369_c0_g1~~TRINITY_DN22369_c0_g1_i1.p1  ORF type:complete len:599 (-),score=180.98 TRINITY_DN22369_c0_g1_i1:193-1989(-)